MSGGVDFAEVPDPQEDADSMNESRKTGDVCEDQESPEKLPSESKVVAPTANVDQRVELSKRSQSNFGVRNYVSEMDNAKSILDGAGRIISSISCMNQEPPQFLLQRNEQSSVIIATILQAIPAEGWCIIVISLVLLSITLAFSQNFVIFVVTIGFCFTVLILGNHLGFKIETKAYENINRLIGENHRIRDESRNSTAKYVKDKAAEMYDRSQSTVTKIFDIQADVVKAEIQATKDIEVKEIEKDVNLKQFEENGKTAREKQKHDMDIKRAKLGAETKKNINAATNKNKLEMGKIWENMRQEELKTNVAIKSLETTKATAIAILQKDENFKKIDAEAAINIARVEAQSNEIKETARIATQEMMKDMEIKKDIAQMEHMTKMREAEEQTKRVELKEAGKTAREGCIIF